MYVLERSTVGFLTDFEAPDCPALYQKDALELAIVFKLKSQVLNYIDENCILNGIVHKVGLVIRSSQEVSISKSIAVPNPVNPVAK